MALIQSLGDFSTGNPELKPVHGCPTPRFSRPLLKMASIQVLPPGGQASPVDWSYLTTVGGDNIRCSVQLVCFSLETSGVTCPPSISVDLILLSHITSQEPGRKCSFARLPAFCTEVCLFTSPAFPSDLGPGNPASLFFPNLFRV